jgi:hypothetical protein
MEMEFIIELSLRCQDATLAFQNITDSASTAAHRQLSNIPSFSWEGANAYSEKTRDITVDR